MDNELCRNLGLRIRELRIARGLKQGELADILEMERSNLTRIETGRQRPNDDNIQKLAEILHIDIKDLFDFGHLKSKKELENRIIAELSNLTAKETQYLYKSIQNLKELR